MKSDAHFIRSSHSILVIIYMLNLQSTINLLNDFCADTQNFSYAKLVSIKLKGLTLKVEQTMGELSLMVNTEEDYQMLQWCLTPQKRFYELLGLHFKKVHLFFGAPDESIEQGIYLDTILLRAIPNCTGLRDANLLGTRFRRILNVALQGHIGVLKIDDNDEIEQLRIFWEGGRITQLLEKYDIVAFDDASGKIIKLWRPRRFKEGEQPVIVIG